MQPVIPHFPERRDPPTHAEIERAQIQDRILISKIAERRARRRHALGALKNFLKRK